MADAVITEHTGTRRGPVTRIYQYGREGIRVLDHEKKLQRLYLFTPSLNIMSECDPLQRQKILRRFVFDRNGMLEETFSFGRNPRTFRYENGGQQIAVREGGQYGAVGKIFSFDRNGISETAWGRHGEIERVYVFDSGDDTITERKGGWFETVDRTVVFEGIYASVFRQPEAFLQFLMFTERREGDVDRADHNSTADITHGDGSKEARSRFAFTGKRHTSSDTFSVTEDDILIDIIPEEDASSDETPEDSPNRKKSSEISFAERTKGGKS